MNPSSPPDASVDAAAPSPAPAAAAPRFRRFVHKTPLDGEQKRRQAAVTDAAWRAFRDGGAMMAFLNTEHPTLGGRPMDLAVNSDAGLTAVLAALPVARSA